MPSAGPATRNHRSTRRRLNSVPVRWRLTLLFACFLAAALLIFGIVTWVGLRWTFYGALDEQVESQTALVMLTIQEQGGNLLLYPRDIGDLESDEHFVRLLDAERALVTDTSRTFGGVPLDLAPVEQALRGRTQITSVPVEDETFRVMTTPVMAGDTVIGVLQVGMSREEIDEALRALVTLLLICGPLVLLVAAAGGYFLSGRAIAPVREIADKAAAVEASDLGARLHLDLPDDELGQLARTFDTMLARIDAAFEHQRRFTGDAAHELRTPLSLMQSQVDLALLGERSNADYRQALSGLQTEIQRLTDIVATLLMVARSDAGHLVVHHNPFDLSDTMEAVRDQFEDQATEAGLFLHLESQPCELEADEDLLLQVLVNLVSNALAATPAGGTVTLGCRPHGEEAEFWVSDTGAGIPLEQQDRVFDRFFRASQTSPGAGLGLNISQAIVHAHGGRISLTSEPGNGTSVLVQLPIAAKD